MNKKILALFLVVALFACFAACGGKNNGGVKPSGEPPLTEEEIPSMYADADKYKGREVTLKGVVFGDPEKDDTGIYFQFYADPENYEKNTFARCADTSVELHDEDYIVITGLIGGTASGENAFGGKVSAPVIDAQTVTIADYITVMSPTLKAVEVNEEQEQYGYKVIFDKVEFAEKETRVYLTVINNGSAEFSPSKYSSKIVQNGKQYEYDFNYYADYEELQNDIVSGVTSSGVLTFPKIEQADFKFIIGAYSDNWEESIEDYSFEISVK